MKIDFDKLSLSLDKYANPKWGTPDEEWALRPGGGEIYIQEKVLAKGSPFLARELIEKSPSESILNALKCNMNLLSQYESMFANVFVRETSEDDLRKWFLDLIHGTDELGARLKRFLDWAKLESIPGQKRKKGINATVASYLLALWKPREYAYCKPETYNHAVIQFLGKAERRTAPLERLLHCNEFYKPVLSFLESKYGLQNGNLFDVHSLFFLFYEESRKPSGNGPPQGIGDPLQLTDSTLYDKLLERHNVVLYGPPGTGKTRKALECANSWKAKSGEDSVALVTFHPSYCYEDFMEGYRPDPKGEGFALKDGVFKKFCTVASKNPERSFLLIVDEINRGDVARILGEAITLIEADKRGKQFCVTLQQSGEPFYVPENLYLLGTMNTADKSISLMDLAIRRRFLFFPCYPDPDVLDQSSAHVREIKGIRLSQMLVGINQRLMEAGIDRDRVLGHSYFMIKKDSPEPLDALRDRFIYEIIPLLEEYFYADRSRLGIILPGLVDDLGQSNEDVFENPERLIEAFLKLRIAD